MDFIEDYKQNNITIQELSSKYSISVMRINKILKEEGIPVKHYKTKMIALEADAKFEIFIHEYLREGYSMTHYAERFGIPVYSLNKRLSKYFASRKK